LLLKTRHLLIPPPTETSIPILPPTETSTDLPSVTPPPTFTPTDLPSETPTAIPSETSTLAPLPTDTPSETSTATLTPEITNIDASTASATVQLTASVTLPATPTAFNPSATPSHLTIPFAPNARVGILSIINRTASNVTQLRTEITNANNNCSSGETYIIDLTGTSPYTITDSIESFYGNNGLPVIRCDITIKGNGKTIQRSSSILFRILAVDQTGKLTLDNITITGGSASETGGSGVFAFFGQMVITNNSFISNNTLDFTSGAEIIGAGIYSYHGSVTIDHSTISNNSNNNMVGDGGGIGINAGQLTMTSATISLNKTKRLGGGLFFTFASTSTITNADIRNNSFNVGDPNPLGGGLYVQSSPLNITNGCIVGNANISFYSTGQQSNANDNWWGASGGPNTTGADTTNGSTNVSSGAHKQSAPSSCTQSATATPTLTPTRTPTPTATATGNLYNCPCSLWTTSNIPAVSDSGNNAAVEVGVKFQSAVAGSINGMRFYKDVNNTGTHTGHLWTSGGTLLASVTFTGESSSGWQTATFSSPISISASTLYIISYHTPSGRFSYTSNYFTSAWTNGPLTAPDSTSSGGNGVYTIGGSGSFPTSSASSPNFWVDVIFSPTGSPTLTPTRTPTPTATVPICTNGLAANGAAPQDSACSQLTPTATATNCPPNFTLANFGIVLENSWTSDEITAIVTAACETGKALSAQGAASTAIDAFREVMQGLSSGQLRQIKFSRIDTRPNSPVCITAKTPDGTQFSANIQCDLRVVMNQYTAVHEFGHVFVGRTTINGDSSYLMQLAYPNGQGGGPLRDPNGVLVIGAIGYNLRIGSRIDWQRSDLIRDNGWGSAAQWDQVSYYSYDFPIPPTGTPTAIPLYVPKIGPCGEGVPTLPAPVGTPFAFQQNPCTFPNWEASSTTGSITEIEEAASDMFLNWVYYKNYGNSTAFLDKLWRSSTCYFNGCSDPGLSGQIRSNWMNTTMTTLFTQFGW